MNRLALRLFFPLVALGSSGILTIVACSEETQPAATPDAAVIDSGTKLPSEDGEAPEDTGTTTPVDSGTRPTCKGNQETAQMHCDDFDQGSVDLETRGWSTALVEEANTPEIVSNDDAPSAPKVLEALTEPPDASGVIADYRRAVISDKVTTTKPIATLEADVFVEEWTSGTYRLLHFDYGAGALEGTGVTLDIADDGTWRCVGFGAQGLSKKEFRLNEWHHVRIVMATDAVSIKTTCFVDADSTPTTPAQLSPSKERLYEIGVTTYSKSTPRVRALFDNVFFYTSD